MPFCYSPWTNVDISAQGKISPCCKFQHEHYKHQRHNIITSDIKDYANGDLLKEIKQDFLNNKWPVGCERCKIEEENNIESKRQLDYTRWKNAYDAYDIEQGGYLTVSIAFGNTCNLKCITCKPNQSSRWHNEYKLIYGPDIKPNYFYKKNFVEEIISECPNLVHVDIPGGEPMLSGVAEQKELLNHYVVNGKAKNISLHYTTNNTIFPDEEWWELWKNFKEIDIQMSIDGIENRNEYIRFPSKWHENEQCIDNFIQKENELHNLRLSVSHTVSAYSVLYLDEFFSWCHNKKLPKPWLGGVFKPYHMRYSVFPESIRKQIVQQLKKSIFPDILVWAYSLENSDDSEYFEMFLEKTQAHDDYRKNSFKEAFPELAEMIANYQNSV